MVAELFIVVLLVGCGSDSVKRENPSQGDLGIADDMSFSKDMMPLNDMAESVDASSNDAGVFDHGILDDGGRESDFADMSTEPSCECEDPLARCGGIICYRYDLSCEEDEACPDGYVCETDRNRCECDSISCHTSCEAMEDCPYYAMCGPVCRTENRVFFGQKSLSVRKPHEHSPLPLPRSTSQEGGHP
jgi:hypothetical protein